MKITLDESVEKTLEKLATTNGMFAPEFTRMVIREMLRNEEHKKYYAKLARDITDKKIRQADEYLARKYTPKNKCGYE